MSALLSKRIITPLHATRNLSPKDKNLMIEYQEKKQASEAGAKWDKEAGLWYADYSHLNLLLRWPLKIIPYKELKGENREFGGNELFVDLIPQSCWFTNVRSCVHPADWDALRRYIYTRAGHRCECCDIDGDLEAHERWHYDEEEKTQKLIRLIALCRDCHETTHIGLAEVKGRGYFAKRHLMRVSGMTEQAANTHIEQAFQDFERRSQYNWKLDLGIIENSDIRLTQETGNLDRTKISEDKAMQADIKRINTEAKYPNMPTNRSHAIPETHKDDKPEKNFQKSVKYFLYMNFIRFCRSQDFGLFGISTILIALVVLLQVFPAIFGLNLTFYVECLVIIIFSFIGVDACSKNFTACLAYIGIGVGGYFLEYWHIFNIYNYLGQVFVHIIAIIGLIGLLLYAPRRNS